MWERIKKLFTRKKVEDTPVVKRKKIDMSDIKFNFNLKSICFFETLTNKSFFKIKDEDIIDMLYSIYIVNNPDKQLNRESFNNIIQKKEFLLWMVNEYSKYSEVISQFSLIEEDEVENNNTGNSDNTKTRISDYVSTLIIEHGLDPHYAFYEMDIWEIKILYDAVESKLKKDMTDKRFWTYMSISPHIDTKKCKSPENLLPFDWEKGANKKHREEELNKNAYAIKNMIGKSIFGDEG